MKSVSCLYSPNSESILSSILHFKQTQVKRVFYNVNSRFSVMGTDGQWVPPPLVLLKQTCWLQEFQRECPFKCCKTASYKQLFGEDRNKDHRQPGQGVYKKLSRGNYCSECSVFFLTLIKSNNFPQEISVSALQKNLILTITGEINKCSFPCVF